MRFLHSMPGPGVLNKFAVIFLSLFTVSILSCTAKLKSKSSSRGDAVTSTQVIKEPGLPPPEGSVGPGTTQSGTPLAWKASISSSTFPDYYCVPISISLNLSGEGSSSASPEPVEIAAKLKLTDGVLLFSSFEDCQSASVFSENLSISQIPYTREFWILAKAAGSHVIATESTLGANRPADTITIAELDHPVEFRSIRVLGQPDPTRHIQYELGFHNPYDSAVCDGKLFVADYANNRVLVWNAVPTVSATPADLVLGQTSMKTGALNPDGVTATALGGPVRVSCAGGKLFVTEYLNNRIAVWNSSPVENNQPADFFLGQGTPTGNSPAAGASGLRLPMATWTDGVRLIVADAGNNRVLVWSTLPSTSGAPADVVLGQPDMNSNAVNNGGRALRSLYYPYGVTVVGTRLIVADKANNRILIWNAIPTTHFQPADLVLGQADGTLGAANAGGLSLSSLSSPMSVSTDGTRLAVPDFANNRLLIWNSIPSVSNTAADLVLGQPDGTTYTTNNGGISARSLYGPTGINFVNGSLWVSDYGNNRVLIWQTLPSSSFSSSQLVLGKHTFSSGGAIQPTNTGLSTIYGVSYDGKKLDIADTYNHRTLLWNALPADSMKLPDIVMGQADIDGVFPNGGAVSPNSGSFTGLVGIAKMEGRFYVTDTDNHRILIFNKRPEIDFAPADAVIGQPDLVSAVANAGGISATSLKYPFVTKFFGGRMFVADTANNRVLIWNSIPTTTTPADVVIGQPDFSGNAPNNGGVTGASMFYPYDLTVDTGRLFVVDSRNHRVLVWNSIPTTSGISADFVIGQSGFGSNGANEGGLSASSLDSPGAIVVWNDRIYISDSKNHRILGFPKLVASNHVAADTVFGQSNFTSNVANSGSGASPGQPNAASLNFPIGMSADHWRLAIADSENHRVLFIPVGD